MVRIAQIAVLAFASFSLAAPAEDPSTAVEATVEDVGGSFASLDALAELGLSGGDDGDANIADVGGSSTKKGLRLITTKKGSRKNQTLTTVGRELGKEKELKLLKEFLKNLEKNLEKGVIGGGPVPSPSTPPKSSTSSASKPPTATATTSKPAATTSGAATSKPAASSTTGAPKASSSTPPSASSGAPKATSSSTTGTAKVITTSIIPTPSPKPASELDAAIEGKEPEAPKETEGEAAIKETEGKEGEHESA
ncbi:hypothetical protein AAL_05833 [Moelleriella libera RCEF 2490]|uniref:Uncharacterized protein n=1 Tax=Moelleriella libera RCEF 2490 TaxID=1081109 RepID=A0A167ZL25_9HYPO|nr:hypothetical protein AAL_05833 [Moelleriella libera RCEF 2490]